MTDKVFVKYMQDGFERYEEFSVTRLENGGYDIDNAVNYAESLLQFGDKTSNVRLEMRVQ